MHDLGCGADGGEAANEDLPGAANEDLVGVKLSMKI